MNDATPIDTAAAAPSHTPIDRTKADWYKDALIYQTHIKAFADSNGDGIGDFVGLTRKLDYIAELGVDTIWLLPFYPSPLRDDGYDIADYESVNPAYGTFEDFAAFVEAAHARGLRVITELVINHTSDQHPWFRRAREAPEGSSERDFYVWSDTDEKWPETRIIFTDTERSNWTWDPVAKQYFWHRFYSHQPDLNFDHPPVMDEVLRIMKLWLDTGVDGLRLDAIPYLVERDGTNNENLPETHAVLKRIRAELDQHYPDRMLLAEANQWPEDTRPYFGEGDECHMGFHFPLMPRMYMALAQEDRHPITDILRQTPPIPAECQWAIFLRNHDELTLEMVTDRERDYMWNYYASDRRARINMGIRRRLAPLLGNDRRKIELMNAMLFSMPGTPVVYYGDEIGMGDNYYLGDRDGVRTPMQWSGDRNGGFSRANPQQLYLPAIQDPVYGYEAVNVEAQSAQPSSLLNWMKTQIGIRRRSAVFGRGEMHFLYPGNRKVLAYTRSLEGEDAVLCVFNISRSAQAVELDLSAHEGAVPVELASGNAFPPVGHLPYMLTLPPFGFFWFQLSPDGRMPEWHVPHTEVMPEFRTLTCRDASTQGALAQDNRAVLERDILPVFLPLQRWFAAKGGRIQRVRVRPGASVKAGGRDYVLAQVDVDVAGETQIYLMPLGALWGEDHVQPGAPTLPMTLAKLRRTNRLGALIDAAHEASFVHALVAAMRDNVETQGFSAHGYDGVEALQGEPRPLGVEQSNVSVAIGEGADGGLLKIYRRLRAGVQPDVEVSRFLTQVGYANTPALLGEARMTGGGPDTIVAAAFAFVPNQGDGWSAIVDALARDIEDRLVRASAGPIADTGGGARSEEMSDEEIAALTVSAGGGADADGMEEGEPYPYPLDLGGVIGTRTAELHAALATPTDDPAFGTADVTGEDVAAWGDDARAQAARAFEALRAMEARPQAASMLLERQDQVEATIARLSDMAPHGIRSRIHGDYHLGQILVSQGDIVVIDFEGEPLRSMEERRALASPWRDVAGMLRSFDYAAHAALDRLHNRGLDGGEAERLGLAWRDSARADFMEAYAGVAGPHGGRGDPVLDLFLLTKALYEIVYEAGNRPNWVSIPVRGVLRLIEGEG